MQIRVLTLLAVFLPATACLAQSSAPEPAPGLRIRTAACHLPSSISRAARSWFLCTTPQWK